MMKSFLTIASKAVREHQAVQKPTEFAALLECVARLDPYFVLEIGSYRGGTLWGFIQALYSEYSPPPRVWGIDNGSGLHPPDYAKLCKNYPIITANDDKMKNLIYNHIGVPQFLFIDGDHSYNGVKADFERWFIPGEMQVAFHDILPHKDKNVGVHRFWNEIKLPTSKEFCDNPLDWGGIGIL